MVRWAIDWLLDYVGCTRVGSVVFGSLDRKRWK